MATILTKKSDTASSVPSAAQLTNSATGAELAVNTADKRLYTKDSGGNVVELGTNPSSLTLPNGTANGVAYLNGSKVLTTGSALTFDGTNLGIGNTSPSSYNGAADNLVIGSSGSNGMTIVSGTANAGYIMFADGTTGQQAYEGQITYDHSVNQMWFNVNASEQMRLTSTGLGIGTSSPDNKLVVSGGIAATGAGSFGASNVAGLYASYESGGEARLMARGTGTTTNYLTFWTTTSGSSSEKMRLDSSGNLGLGVTPSAWSGVGSALELKGNAYIASTSQVLSLATNAFYNGSNWIYKSSSYANLYETVFGQHRWSTAPSGTAGNAISFTQAMTLDASGNLSNVGNVSFNTGGLATYLRASGSSYTQIGDNQTLGAGTAFIIGSSPAYLGFQTAGSERARIDASGNLLVGTTSNGGKGVSLNPNGGIISNVNSTSAFTHLEIKNNNGTVGSIVSSGTTTAYNTSSDYRLKNITGPVTNSGAYIDSLKPVEGTWKADGSTFVGLIAHEVQEVSRTQVATGEKDGEQMQAMDYSSSEIIANLIAEVQSLRKRLAAAGIA